ncbi:MAG: helicase [Rhizobiales bacterium]|nr:helicase [Hyphomicrobiales bacterium]
MPISFSSPSSRDSRARGAGVTAVLGPTNTGKTHLAIERMLGHSSGIIGLPLRLLAREVYNKCVDRVGVDVVALVTGEEKIKPANPRYWVATVEAMPRDLDVAFLAVDEIQLGADLERGHVFTDRMLHRRAREETLVLGAATMRPMVEKLLPGAHIISRPRLSLLTFAGEKKLTRLPRRSAVVVFSAEEVYAIGELIRRQRGGVAVVLGALSPRTRNAQVAMYQSGEVDYLVATDAIGMGLNLDVDHVAFASDRKFDGYQYRKLNPSELAQIAGRAGRATRDGTFGTTGRCPPFEDELVHQLESHAFEPVKVLQWRNAALDFSSLGALQASLAVTPTEPGLTRAPIAEDIQVLDHAARDEEVRALVKTPQAVERLWDVCQIPDYRKIAPATHAELAGSIYRFLMREGRIPIDWFAHQVEQADRTDGGIDTLSARIAHIRTWTFAANRPDWLEDPEHWQNVTRGVEDKLSDALHERLTERFVDRRTSVLMRRLRENTMPEAEIGKSGEVVIEGHVLGRLDGFTFAADPSAGGSEAKALHAAAQKALAGEIEARASRLAQAPDEQFVLASDGAIRWLGEAAGKLIAGEDALRPRVRIVADEHLTGPARDAVQARLDLWLRARLEKLLGPLFALIAAEDVTGIARGVAFQLVEALGVLERQKVADDVKGLDQSARAALRKYGVRFGAYHIYLPLLLKPAARSLAAQLAALKHAEFNVEGFDDLQHLAASGRTSIPAKKDVPNGLYRTIGYRVCGERAVRVDILERLADLIRGALTWRPGAPGQKPAGALDGSGFIVAGAMTSLIGASGEDMASILRSLGYRMEQRPKPVEAAPAPAAIAGVSEAVTAISAATETAEDLTSAEAGPSAAADSTAVLDEPVPIVPDGAEAESQESASALEQQAASASSESEDTQPCAVADSAEPAAPSTDDAAQPTAVGAAAKAAPAVAEEAVLIEVWRPGRRSDERRGASRPPRGRNRQGQRLDRRAPAQPQAAVAADAAADVAAAASPAPAEDQHQRRGHRPDRPSRREGEQRGDRPPRHEREQRRPPFKTRPPAAERRDKLPDPNSPFAKLAALKEQLEAASKERR